MEFKTGHKNMRVHVTKDNMGYKFDPETIYVIMDTDHTDGTYRVYILGSPENTAWTSCKYCIPTEEIRGEGWKTI